MTWILLILGILEFVLPLILKWLQSKEDFEANRNDCREWILQCRDAISKLEVARLKNAVERKRFAKVKALYGKVRDQAVKAGVQL